VVIAGSYILFGVSLSKRQTKRKQSGSKLAGGLIETRVTTV
jgi:hypothetical protein